MDPQIEEYRRIQREKAAAASAASKSVAGGGMKPSFLVVVGVIAAAALVSMGRTQSSTADSASPQGVCPAAVGVGVCVEECASHDDCQGQGKMCCSNGCGHVCMDPVAPGHVAPETKCTLMITLTEKDKAADEVLAAVPKPSEHSHLASVGIVILDYKVGRSADCCAAERALHAKPESAKFVEYDGAKPSCAVQNPPSGEPQIVDDGADFIETGVVSEDPPSETGEVYEEPIMGGDEDHMVGGYGAHEELDEESLGVWDQVLTKNPEHKSLGKPVSVSTQVVAGTNYNFKFKDGSSVVVFHQPWSDTLEVSEPRK